MFVIFGASGNTGSVVANELIARGKKVRVVARNPEKVAALAQKSAEVFPGDITDAASFRGALAGAEGAYFLIPPDVASKTPIERAAAIVDGFLGALAANPVKHVVLLSSVGAQLPSGTGPIVTVHDAEKRLAAVKGTAVTFIRAAYFMENILGSAHAITHDGVLPVFGGGESYPFPMVATKDIGLAAANALLAGPESVSGPNIIELSGPKEESFNDAAKYASEILGRAVTTKVLPIDLVVPTFVGFGMSNAFAELYREMIAAFGSGSVKFDGKGKALRGKTSLRELLGALKPS